MIRGNGGTLVSQISIFAECKPNPKEMSVASINQNFPRQRWWCRTTGSTTRASPSIDVACCQVRAFLSVFCSPAGRALPRRVFYTHPTQDIGGGACRSRDMVPRASAGAARIRAPRIFRRPPPPVRRIAACPWSSGSWS